MTVSVAIDLALDRLFTYEVPAALREKLAVGQLLSVPFGHREARGFAMAVGEGAVAKGSYCLKPITAIVDETPLFSAELLSLVRKVAAYYAAPVESVLKTALPAAVLKRNVRAKEQLFVEALETASARQQEGLTDRQRWLYDQIVRLDGGWMTQLCAELKTTPPTVRELAKKGLVAIAVRERRRSPISVKRIMPSKPLPLNDEQAAALAAIGDLDKRGARGARDASPALVPHVAHVPRVLLLHGVTGSGKTEVYLQAIAKELAANRGAIVMVPEISLTPQTVQRFASRFGDRVAVLHSALSDGERYDEWHRIRSGEARVVVGPRSAVWAPVRDLGLIVVDEEHEASYKQEDGPRYHARDVAVLRGAIEGAKVVLGSATPSLESWMNVGRGKYVLATMCSRAGTGRLPTVQLVDMRQDTGRRTMDGKTGGAIFSQELLEAIRLRLDRHEQTILFLNRRGYSRSYVCTSCGYVATCPSCDVPYTYHRADSCLRCHVCGGWILPPKACPQCQAASFQCQGVGTQRVEAALAKCFPRAKVLRMDADSTSRKNSHDDILGAFRRQEADVLIGTQMIAKGLDFPNVTLVGVLNADSSLRIPDFRAGERTFQLLAQVSGRAGRAELPGEVFIQSYDPSVPVIQAARNADFRRFAEAELKTREDCFLPPHCHLAVIWFRSQNLKLTGDWAMMYAESLKRWAKAGTVGGQRPTVLEVSEAMPSELEKADGWYRWLVTLRSVSPATIVRAWRWISDRRPPPKELRLTLDLDAFNVV